MSVLLEQHAVRERALPVIEVFGPVIQGEGPLAGTVTDFVRFGGCDYRCSWCDSLYAVIPKEVRANAERLSVGGIVGRIDGLGSPARTVTLSGGNPALLDLGPLVRELRASGRKVAVETQGSVWKPWLVDVQSLVVSPKPPSSGMADKTDADLPAFMDHADKWIVRVTDALKVVVFDGADFAWALDVFARYPEWPAFVSVGSDPPVEGEPLTDTLAKISDRYARLCSLVAHSDECSRLGVRVLPQLHVIAFGHARGV